MPDLPISPLSGPDAASLLGESRRLSRIAPGDPAALHHAAVQFESVLLGQWLQSAEKSFASVPGSAQEEDAGGEQMMSFGLQQLATALANSGGLGIARLVERELMRAGSNNGDKLPAVSTPAQAESRTAAPHDGAGTQ